VHRFTGFTEFTIAFDTGESRVGVFDGIRTNKPPTIIQPVSQKYTEGELIA